MDVSMCEGISALIGNFLLDYAMTGQIPQRIGNANPRLAPHGVYPCLGEDEWVSIVVGSDTEWDALCGAMDQPESRQDPRYGNNAARCQHRSELDEAIGAWTEVESKWDIQARLQAAGVAAVATYNARDLHKDAHLLERGVWQQPVQPNGQKYRIVSSPWKLSRTPVQVGPAPLIGADNDYVFCEILRLSSSEIETLRGDGVIG